MEENDHALQNDVTGSCTIQDSCVMGTQRSQLGSTQRSNALIDLIDAIKEAHDILLLSSIIHERHIV